MNVHVGDELLKIDETDISTLPFSDMVKFLKDRIHNICALLEKDSSSDLRKQTFLSKRSKKFYIKGLH